MRKRLLTRLKNMRLSRKMILVYVIFAGISCIISITALQVSFNIYDEKLYEKSLQELDFFTQQVNASLQEIEELSMDIAMDKEVQNKLSQIFAMDPDSSGYAYEMNNFRYMLLDRLAYQPTVQNIMYTDGQKVRFLIGVDRGAIDDAVYEELLEQYHERRGGYVMQPPTGEYPYLLSGRDILERISNTSLDYLGSIIITSDIAGVIKRKVNALEADHSKLFVYSEGGMIYQEEDMAEAFRLPFLNKKQGYEIIRRKGQKYFMCYLKSSSNGWMYVNLFPYSEVFGQTMALRYLMLIGFAAVFLMTLLAMEKMSNVITRPLVRLAESMQVVATGDFEGAKILMEGEKHKDETGLLAQEFQIMLEKINVLIRENYEKQLLLKDTKYKMLQAQINPHFLYNTLNAINWMVKAKRNDDAGKMIMELGYLLHASFAEDPYITVEDEVHVAKSYITIQQFRYGARAEFTVITEGNLEGYIIPRMVLQPLIENAIYYGVEGALGNSKVDVVAKEEAEGIVLEVSDTGSGMTEEELESVRNFRVKPKGHGIGLSNIRERLNISYDNYEFTIDSRTGEGTVIRIRIPKIKGEGYHV
ncbi:two-component system sensor histidine kinase YesM [Anaerotaenia torta]|uniref:sensor histidine kinase n=1 Tax=Anaerotaenia torta TaxID=433293 RepID=UPI003D1AFDF5